MAELERMKKQAEELLQAKRQEMESIHQERQSSLLELERLKRESVTDIVLEKKP